jgi:membrane-associated phospholipid phosphatase
MVYICAISSFPSGHMDKLRRIFLVNRSFFTGLLLFLISLGSYLLFTSRANSFILLNPYHSAWLDQFFIYFTNLGDGIFSIIIFLVLLSFRKVDSAIQVLTAFLLSGLLSQIIKSLVNSPRPKDYFALATDQIHIIKDITLSGGASFPSGHSTTAFALATSIALLTKSKENAWWYLIPAILVGYSRVYLSQHFPKDVFAGAVIGASCAVIVYLLIEKLRLSRSKNKSNRNSETTNAEKNVVSFQSVALTSLYDL